MDRRRSTWPSLSAVRAAPAAAVGPSWSGCSSVLRPPGGGASSASLRFRPCGQEAAPADARRRAVPAVEVPLLWGFGCAASLASLIPAARPGARVGGECDQWMREKAREPLGRGKGPAGRAGT